MSPGSHKPSKKHDPSKSSVPTPSQVIREPRVLQPLAPSHSRDVGLVQQAFATLILLLSIASGLTFVVGFHWLLVMRLPGY